MAYNVGFNNRVNGGVSGGEFLTGSMDFFTIATLVPVFPTNVTTPLTLLYTQQGYSTWQPVSVVDGTGTTQTYNTAAAYQDAFTKQSNLNMLTLMFAQNINPVAISVNYATSSNPSTIALSGTVFNSGTNYSYSNDFGSSYSSSQTVYYVKFITEKTGYWYVNGTGTGIYNSNANGYQLLDAFENATTAGVTIYDLQTTVLASYSGQPSSGTVTSLSGQTVSLNYNVFEVNSATTRNTVAFVATLASDYHNTSNNALPTP